MPRVQRTGVASFGESVGTTFDAVLDDFGRQARVQIVAIDRDGHQIRAVAGADTWLDRAIYYELAVIAVAGDRSEIRFSAGANTNHSLGEEEAGSKLEERIRRYLQVDVPSLLAKYSPRLERQQSSHPRSSQSLDSLVRLRQSSEHVQAFCLECGYEGPMGVLRRVIPWYLSYWALIPAGAIAWQAAGSYLVLRSGIGASWWILVIIFVVLFGIRMARTQTVMLCPACGAELTSTSAA